MRAPSVRLPVRPSGRTSVQRGGSSVLPLVPVALVLVALVGWPLGRAVWDSLWRESLSAPGDRRFVGLAGYVDVLGSSTWWAAAATTAGFVVVCVVLQLALATAFTAALRRVTVGRGVLRLLVLVPLTVLGAGAAVVWREAFTAGFVADWFGLDGDGALASVAAAVATEVWRGTAISTAILLARAEQVSPRLLVAAQADGATARQRLRFVTWPAMAPAVAVVVVYRALDALRAFEGPLLAESGTRLRTLPLLVVDQGLGAGEIGLGATLSVLTLVLLGLVIGAVMGLVRLVILLGRSSASSGAAR